MSAFAIKLSRKLSLYDGQGKTRVKSLTDLGEAANNIMKLAPDLKQSDPVAWQHLSDIYAMRIRLTHTYHRTNPNIVFDTVQNDLPAIERLLVSIAATASRQRSGN